ncbi:twitching motility protein PilT [Klebsiella pneumoniae]|uniref:Twitching motility protein PilT n=1 Tax=Klebsiella pneumoniae TaxID=573 RepID=A0A2X3F6B3_KLEPN|nr:twitching motility protein PilT [Klebsiella pneumoniae]
MATLHTRGAAPAVERLIDVFPAEEKDQVRSQLAGSLCAVLAQKIVTCTSGRESCAIRASGQHASGGEFDP